ncbi:MAG: hypothetical protein ACXAEL_16590, partial [Candidatus Hodarchaeales archaeon]
MNEKYAARGPFYRSKKTVNLCEHLGPFACVHTHICILQGISFLKADFSLSEKITDEMVNFRAFTAQADLDGCVDLFSADFGLPEDDVRNFLLSIDRSKETITHLVLQAGPKIVGHGAVMRNTREPTKGMLNAIHASTPAYLGTLLTHLSSNCKKEGITTLYMNFTHLDN